MESIQRMAPEGSPLVALAQQRVEVVNVVVAQWSAGKPRGEPSIGNQSNDRGKRAWSEEATSASGNRHLADNDVQWRITQNHYLWECGRDRKDLSNVIDDQRRRRARSPIPPRRSLARDVTPSGSGGFCALVAPLRDVRWPDKFKIEHIDKYDGSNNPKEFVQVYQTVIEAVGGDDQVKANYLPTALTDTARSWLINLLEGSIYTWDQLCAMFIGNFQGMYERPSTTETLKTIRQKHDKSLWDYMKCFCNASNAISYIQDIKIINAFRDEVSDIKTMEEITMKKPKTVADLLAVAVVCIEASEAQAWPLESHGKGPSKKKQDDREVNVTDRGDRKDRGDHGYHDKQSSNQKEKRPFWRLDNVEKWCKIHRTSGHDLE
jgi:hypothetical protein